MKKCSNCGNEISYLDLYCPYCKFPVKDYFTIEAFLIENFQFFVIIGVIGTMISLLPNLGNLIMGENWITRDIYNIFSSFLMLIITFGGLFIIAIFCVIIIKIFNCRRDEKNILFFKKGDFQRFVLLGCLLPMMIGFFLFIIPSIIIIPNPLSVYFSFILAAVGYILLYVVTLYILFEIPFIKKTIPIRDIFSRRTEIFSRFRKGIRKKPHVFIIILLALVIEILFLNFVLPIVLPPPSPPPYSDNIKIEPDRLYYSPLNSPTTGLLLGFTNISNKQLAYTSFQWSTNYGYFISYDIRGTNEKILGDQSKNLKVYWSYPREDISQNKNPVTIKLTVTNLTDNSIVTNTSINLTWFSRDIVFVNYSYR